jgi:hypothetical protein
MQIRNSILTPDVYPRSSAADAFARCSARTLLVYSLTFAAVSCTVYDPGLLDNAHPKREHTASAAVADSSVEEGSDCDAGLNDAGDCAPDAAPPAEPNDDPAPREQVQPQRDADDECPNDPNKLRPGTCGCDKPDTDTDLDGTADCKDGCPRDEHKTAAGSCGCGALDSDTDADGTPDCLDACPRDGNKTSVGMCGCGTADTDSDEDETADCIDECPRDPSKTAVGLCGCGWPEPSKLAENQAGCGETKLLHRYSFDGSGNVVRDLVGDASGAIATACGASQSGGALAFSGEAPADSNGDCYVSLPRAAWPASASATFETWITWNGQASNGSAQWQRIFDFGTQVSGEGQTYLCLSPSGDSGVRAEFSVGGSGGQVHVESVLPLPRNVMKQLAIVVDGPSSTLTLYVDGARQGSVQLPATLAMIEPMNLWLGRSSFERDPAFFGRMHEFRIYGAALTESQLQKSREAGPEYGLSR